MDTLISFTRTLPPDAGLAPSPCRAFDPSGAACPAPCTSSRPAPPHPRAPAPARRRLGRRRRRQRRPGPRICLSASRGRPRRAPAGGRPPAGQQRVPGAQAADATAGGRWAAAFACGRAGWACVRACAQHAKACAQGDAGYARPLAGCRPQSRAPCPASSQRFPAPARWGGGACRPADVQFPHLVASGDEAASEPSSDLDSDDDEPGGDSDGCLPDPEGTRAAAAASGMRIIDYEYSGFNPAAFDIANHWCEWAADYHSDAPHELDFARLPARSQQARFVRRYLLALLAAAGVGVARRSAAGHATGTGAQHVGRAAERADGGACPPSLMAWMAPHLSDAGTLSAQGLDELCKELHAASLAYMCASHAQWALWGWIQARVRARAPRGVAGGEDGLGVPGRHAARLAPFRRAIATASPPQRCRPLRWRGSGSVVDAPPTPPPLGGPPLSDVACCCHRRCLTWTLTSAHTPDSAGHSTCGRGPSSCSAPDAPAAHRRPAAVLSSYACVVPGLPRHDLILHVASLHACLATFERAIDTRHTSRRICNAHHPSRRCAPRASPSRPPLRCPPPMAPPPCACCLLRSRARAVARSPLPCVPSAASD